MVHSSKYTGVRWVESRNKFRAEIERDGVRFHLGYYDKEDEAGAAYKAAKEANNIYKWMAEQKKYGHGMPDAGSGFTTAAPIDLDNLVNQYKVPEPTESNPCFKLMGTVTGRINSDEANFEVLSSAKPVAGPTFPSSVISEGEAMKPGVPTSTLSDLVDEIMATWIDEGKSFSARNVTEEVRTRVNSGVVLLTDLSYDPNSKLKQWVEHDTIRPLVEENMRAYINTQDLLDYPPYESVVSGGYFLYQPKVTPKPKSGVVAWVLRMFGYQD